MARKAKPHLQSGTSSAPVRDFETLLEEYTSRLEVQVARESRFYRLMADSMPQIVWMAETDGRIDYFNQRWYQFTDLSEAESLNQGWLSVVHPDELKEVRKLWQASVKNGTPFEIETRFKPRKKDAYSWFLVRALPGFDSNKKIIKWFGTCTDINEHKKNQASKDEFIAITSHELKTPLTSLKAFNQVIGLQMEKLNHADALDITEKMSTQIDRLNNLINDLLDISLLDTGKLRLKRSRFDFDEFVSSSIEDLRIIYSGHRLVIEGRSGKKIYADRNRLEQALINLVSNAVKYSPKSKKVLIKLEGDESNAIVHVRDYGIGIPRNDQSKIFERFYRVERPLHETPGFGLGLYIAGEILKKQKGRLWVDSQIDKGSTFSFMLPAVKD
jgi:PAS domain S-box-containing protein